MDQRPITICVNGITYNREVETRRTLADFLRIDLHLTGTHVGCEHGVCGACTVLFNGNTARSCLTLAIQADQCNVTTIEGLAYPDGTFSELQQAFRECHGLQCGFCTPGMLTTLTEFLSENINPSEFQVKEAISGNLCRCTGYQAIVDATMLAAKRLREK
ncbi:MAG: (2Fe-2S)-binding protein [Chitinophagia bacterium]|nr:(2Fe-2S)-binding protein [Chitinophagia bacterium]